MRRVRRVIFNVVSFGVLVWYLWYVLKNWELIAIALLSLVLHEAGHALVLKRHGVPSRMSFAPWGAFVEPNRWHYQRLSWEKKGKMVLAGPAVNALLAIFGIILASVGVFPKYMLTVTSINAVLGVLNLLPIIPLDGGQIAGGVLDSLKWRDRRAIAVKVALLSLGAEVLFWLVFNKPDIFITLPAYGFLLPALGLFGWRRSNGPKWKRPKKAMNKTQADRLLVMYLVLFFVMEAIFNFGPYWGDLW